MSTYIPYPFYHDDVPVDISFVFQDERPAGKHGFLKTECKHFVFEDGTKVRFWGTNLNGGANFPDHSYAEKLARRLAKVGINLVRFHQLDSEWNTPNIFSYAKGKPFDGRSFDTQSMDRLDYLIYCLKKEGIYCYMDMFTYRKFRSWEGVANAENLPDAAKPYCIFDEKLIELQKDLCQKLWTHYNPYTELTYADDPVFVMAEILNECHLFTAGQKITAEPYRTNFINMFDRWLKENDYHKSSRDFDIDDFKNEILISFKMEIQEKYFREMAECMRKCGVKIPLTGTNMVQTPANLKTHLMFDFLDDHAYLYDWRWGEKEKYCKNQAITKEYKPFLTRTLATVADKPTFMSEWDMPWPNDYRAESPIYAAAYGLLQDWSGFAIHTYAYTSYLDRMNILGKEMQAEKIGNVPYRQGIFSAWNDPAKFGLFYHSALMTRRGDVSPSKEVIKVPHKCMSSTFGDLGRANWERYRVEADTEFKEFADADAFVNLEEAIHEVTSDTGELYINRNKNYGTVNTPMTKCAYGFLGKNDKIELSGVNINCETDFAVIALSSLTDKDILSSENMLLTAVGRAKNTGADFKNEQMFDLGKAPVCIEVTETNIEIKTSVEGLKVWAISPEGFYIGTVDTTYENGVLKFHLGDVSNSMYYLIVKD